MVIIILITCDTMCPAYITYLVDSALEIINQNTNKIYSEANQIINITVMIENIESMHRDIACTQSKNISIDPLSPKEYEIFANNSSIKFEYRPNSNQILKNCSLYVDGEKINCQRDIKSNETNELYSEKKFTETGIYNWNIKCCDCDSGCCNSTKSMHFKISEKNNTTYVNQTGCASDETRFIYRRISDAINRTTDGGQVVICPGIYEEKLVIDRPLSITGKDWPLLNEMIIVNSDEVNISGLKINNIDQGICISNKDAINISNNQIDGRYTGICAYNCHRCLFYKNMLSIQGSRSTGIYLKNCVDCNISRNHINGQYATGVYINDENVDDNKIKNYIFKDNTFNGVGHNILIKQTEEDIQKTITEEENHYDGSLITEGSLSIEEQNGCS